MTFPTTKSPSLRQSSDMKKQRSLKIHNNQIEIRLRHSSYNNNKYTEYFYKEGKLYTIFRNHNLTKNCIPDTKFYSKKWISMNK